MKQIVCDQCEQVVKPAYRIRLDAMFKSSLSGGYTLERRKLDFCGPTCASVFITDHLREINS